MQFGYTALTSAALRGRVDCVRLLLESGANYEATNVRRMACMSILSHGLEFDNYYMHAHDRIQCCSCCVPVLNCA
jgi:ankyrin repeat protein